ncbi:unnamed protein product [Rotaria sordida]|uniref:t-SNARE coiled-coil homology domain-containing protein n=1 Tax=Rotaria sordida TaxID=392033 RepID=A0A813YG87_9BILA|nr:unnamed protein product [Rotaria sordida]
MNPLESKNDSHTEQLSAKVSRLKNIAIDIDNETKEHNRFLQAMRFDFDTARSFLGGGSRHLGNVMSSGKGDRRFMCYVIGNALPFLKSTSDYYFFLLYTFSVVICMFGSVLFHLFGCMSSRIFADFLKLDLCGIGISILGCYLYGLHITFECYHDWRIRYETIIICITFIAVIYYVHAVKQYITRNIHISLFVIISLLGFLPGLHWYCLHGGWSNRFVQHFFPKLFVLYGILGIGTIVYLTKFPERFFPGYFDFIFASHQIWHISSLCAFIWWYVNGIELLQYRRRNPCHTLHK